MKFKSLFLSGFGCVACHTINHETKTNTFRLILIYGENRNSGALENQLQSFRIFFSIMYLDGFFEPTKVKSLFLSVIGSLVKQTFDLETEINVFTDLVCYEQFLCSGDSKNQFPSFLITFSSWFENLFHIQQSLNPFLYPCFAL